MDESSDPERHDGGASRAAGKHQAGGTSQSGGKHQAGKTTRARGKHQAGGKSHSGLKRQAGKHAASSHGTASLGAAASGAARGAGPTSGIMTVSRRKLLVSGGALAAGFAGLDALRNLAVTPVRVAADPATASLANAHGDLDLPDVQFNLAGFTAPAVTVNDVLVAFPPVFTLFATA
jgi:hypothetical protein